MNKEIIILISMFIGGFLVLYLFFNNYNTGKAILESLDDISYYNILYSTVSTSNDVSVLYILTKDKLKEVCIYSVKVNGKDINFTYVLENSNIIKVEIYEPVKADDTINVHFCNNQEINVKP